MSNRLAAAAAMIIASAAPLAAQPIAPDTSDVAIANNADFIFELGIGGRVQPEFEGSDSYTLSPWPIVSVDYLSIPGLFTVGGSDRVGGLSFGPSFGYVGEREEDDDRDLAGTDDLDATYELGLRVGYEFALSPVTGLEVFGEARGAFGEASGLVGGFGVDAIARPSTVLELKFGPRATFATSDYMSTYFSVSQQESIASGGRLDAFEADGGFKTVGLAASARYEFRPNWFANAEAGYDRLVGDAGDSPIVDVGSQDQFSLGLGLSRRFSLDLF